MTAILRLALVGGGVVARVHAETIGRLGERAKLVAVVTRRQQSAEQLGALSEADPSTSLTDTVSRPDVDAVVVCTPTGLHAQAAVAALEAGKHVLVEKPLDVTVVAAMRVVEAARRSGRVAAVVSQHRFDTASRKVHDALCSGLLGRPTSCVVTMPWWRPQAYYVSAPWRGTRALDGGGALLNQAIHSVDLMTWFLGVPEEVFAWTGRLAHERIDVEDTAVAMVRFPGGALGVAHATTAAYPDGPARVQVHGDRGSAVIEDDRLVVLSGSGDVEAGSPAGRDGDPGDAFLAQYEDFVDAVREGRPPLVDANAGVQTLAVVEAMYRSASSGRPVRLTSVTMQPGQYEQVQDSNERS